MHTASVFEEFEIEVCGNWQPAEPDVGIMSSYYELDDLVGLWVTTRHFRNGKYETKRVNLLDGVDLRSPDVQKLLANIRDQIDTDQASEALAEAAE